MLRNSSENLFTGQIHDTCTIHVQYPRAKSNIIFFVHGPLMTEAKM